jgi:lipopolysaccharide/colanic/teichoic acid biosynthesis glycosyltransferase
MTFQFEMTEPTRTYRAIKRAVDVVLAFIGLALLAVPMLLLALAVLASRGPVLFRQTRIGEGGRPFTMYKFRTMTRTADPYAPKPLGTASYVTRVGRFLRGSGLDELPQLWNVLRGDMSLVGPRPEMPFIVARYEPPERLRLGARPGLTGLWQISTVRNQPIHRGIEYDLFYLSHRRLVLDLWILYRTPLLLLFHRHVQIDQVTARWGRPAPELEAAPAVVLDIADSTAPSFQRDLMTEQAQSS